MDFHIMDRLRDSCEHVQWVLLGLINDPAWDKIIVPVIVGVISAAGSSYVTTVKLEERMTYVIKRLDTSEAMLAGMSDTTARVRILEQDMARLWDQFKRVEDRGTQTRPR